MLSAECIWLNCRTFALLPIIIFISIDQLEYTLYCGSDGNIAIGANILAVPLD